MHPKKRKEKKERKSTFKLWQLYAKKNQSQYMYLNSKQHQKI